MQDYQPISLSTLCNVGTEIIGVNAAQTPVRRRSTDFPSAFPKVKNAFWDSAMG